MKFRCAPCHGKFVRTVRENGLPQYLLRMNKLFNLIGGRGGGDNYLNVAALHSKARQLQWFVPREPEFHFAEDQGVFFHNQQIWGSHKKHI